MAFMTEVARRAARDVQRSKLAGSLRQHEWFHGAPPPVVNGFAELLLVSRELRARIKTEGIMRPDGTLHPAVEAFRKYKHTELGYLTEIADMRRAEHEQARDLVSEMAKAIDLPADLPQSAPAAADGAGTARDEPTGNIEPGR